MPPPKGWRETLEAICTMRAGIVAPVDTMGCASLADKDAEPADRRFQTLAALVLSPQTRDDVTAAAFARVRALLGGSVTATQVASIDEDLLAATICPVGFYRRKAGTLRAIARTCRDDFAGDIPGDYDALVALPGVGPKIAHLTLQCAWGRVEGIGVDVHVDRISRRLGWSGELYRRGAAGRCKEGDGTGKRDARKLSGPEETRRDLEDWMPPAHWAQINKLLVGFGQVVCLPRFPRCEECLLKRTCPSSRAK